MNLSSRFPAVVALVACAASTAPLPIVAAGPPVLPGIENVPCLAAALGGVSMDATYGLWAWVIRFGPLNVASLVKDL